MNTYDLYKKFQSLPMGSLWFTLAVCWRAPYFASIRPRILDLEPGRCVVKVKKRRRVKNHIGTIHAIAMANACELAAGVGIEATLPSSHRWIPKGMDIRYLAKAETDVMATAIIELPQPLGDKVDVIVKVSVRDKSEREVVTADINMYATLRPKR